jgi:Fe2+ or Zn2+ uptake regulation protein
MADFYNTIALTGQHFTGAKGRAKAQQAKILDFFNRNPKGRYGPFDVLSLVFSDVNTPITSVRRSMTNLTEAGFLTKLNEKKVGIYGQENHLWELKKGQMRLF